MALPEHDTPARERIGLVLRGKYRLERILGTGGMATVYAATHRNTKQFAVKMLHPELSVREDIRTRFLREGYVANSVKHPGAVAVMDDDVAEDGSAFLVMELLEGTTVNDLWLHRWKRLPIPLVLSIGDALLDVLVAAHARGIVHRDLKPANLFLTHSGTLKVLDFGIARLLDTLGNDSATMTGTLMGTPAFMAPEQALAKMSDIDAQTDLWAVGATLFALLGGELVHTGDNAPQVLVSAATKPARSLVSVAEEAPPSVARVVDKALSFDKRDRWPSAAAMREALKAACHETSGGGFAPLPKTVPDVAETVTIDGGNWSDDAFAPTVNPTESAPPTPEGVGPTAPSNVASGPTTTGPVTETPTTKPAAGIAVRRPRRRALALSLAGIGLAGAALGVSYRVSHTPRVFACAGVTVAKDGPGCVAELPLATAFGRGERTARLTELQGVVKEIEWVGLRDGREGAPDSDAVVEREEIVRDGRVRGGVVAIRGYDRWGVLVRWEKWSDVVDGKRRIDFVDADGMTPRVWPHTSISTVLVTYDTKGRVAREMYLGPSGRPRPNGDGELGAAFEYGKSSHWTKRHVLGADGQPTVGHYGEVTAIRSDDDSLLGADLSWVDGKGESVFVDGAQHVRRAFDGPFVRGDVRYLGAKDAPAVNPTTGVAVVRRHWDAGKRLLELTFEDEKSHAHPRKGEAAATVRTTYDGRGRAVLVESLDANGNRTATHGGVSAERLVWSDADLVTAREWVDAEGARVVGEEGAARQQLTYDTRGRLVELRSFDDAGKPAPWRDGTAIDHFQVDDSGLVTRVGHYDAAEQPTVDRHGVHETRRKHDQLRNLVDEVYVDVAGQPAAREDGLSATHWEYDENNDLVRVLYLDASGTPLMVNGEYAEERFTYDEQGRRVARELFDAHGERTRVKEGYATVRYAYERNGDMTGESFFGPDDEPVATTLGYAQRTLVYDLWRRVVETRLTGPKGERALGSLGWAALKATYDERGLVVRLDRLDAAGKPVLAHDGAASIERVWDARGNLVLETTLDTAGKPKATASGYSSVRTEYDERDRPLVVSRLSPSGKAATGKDGVATHRLRYDDAGNVVLELFLDAHHAPFVPLGGTYASVQSTFDARQRLSQTAYFDASGAPGSEGGVATIKYARDAYGRAVETSYFDRNGLAVAGPDGNVVVRSTYDALGRVVMDRFVDAAGTPKEAASGCAATRFAYDYVGRVTETACLDSKGELTLSASGFASERVGYDARGNEQDVSTLGANQALLADRDGVARRHTIYDDKNRVLGTTYFDANDHPTNDGRGVHETRFTHGAGGAMVAAAYLDEHGAPVTLEPPPPVVIDPAPTSAVPASGATSVGAAKGAGDAGTAARGDGG